MFRLISRDIAWTDLRTSPSYTVFWGFRALRSAPRRFEVGHTKKVARVFRSLLRYTGWSRITARVHTGKAAVTSFNIRSRCNPTSGVVGMLEDEGRHSLQPYAPRSDDQQANKLARRIPS